MRKLYVCALAALFVVAGCGKSNEPGAPSAPKWKGPPYQLSFDTKPGKPNASGASLPAIKFNANPKALVRRATLVIRFDSSGVKTDKLVINQVVLAAFDISGTDGSLSADTMDQVDKGLAHLLTTYCVNGKVHVSVILEKSSLSPQPDDLGINDNRLSDWASTDIDFKNPKHNCKI